MKEIVASGYVSTVPLLSHLLLLQVLLIVCV